MSAKTARMPAAPAQVSFPCCVAAIGHMDVLSGQEDEERVALRLLRDAKPEDRPVTGPGAHLGMIHHEVEITYCPWCGARVGGTPPEKES
jgi:hypothetical protein